MTTTDKPEISEEVMEEAAAAIVDEAIAPLRGSLSADEIKMLHFLLEGELLLDPEGRATLRRALEDPTGAQSEDVRRRVMAAIARQGGGGTGP